MLHELCHTNQEISDPLPLSSTNGCFTYKFIHSVTKVTTPSPPLCLTSFIVGSLSILVALLGWVSQMSRLIQVMSYLPKFVSHNTFGKQKKCLLLTRFNKSFSFSFSGQGCSESECVCACMCLCFQGIVLDFMLKKDLFISCSKLLHS